MIKEKQPTNEYKIALTEATLNGALVGQYDRLKKKEFGKLILAMQFDTAELEKPEKFKAAQKEMQEFEDFFDEFIWSRMNKPKYPETK